MLAPSSHNTQPWHFIVDGDAITLCADRLRALSVVDPFDRELIISCGAALFNLRAALSHLGLAYAITLFPSSADPDVLAHLKIVPDGHCDATLAPLFEAIARRVTNRAAFSSEPVSPDVQQRLREAGMAEGADVICIDAVGERERIAELIAEADLVQFHDPRFRRELASWIHSSRREDGMPALSAGLHVLQDVAAPLVALAIRTFDLGDGMAATHRSLVTGSPLFLCLATGVDDAPAWLAVGQALERVLLTAVIEGLSASYLNQPIEVDTLRDRLLATPGLDTMPQLLLRIGRGTPVEHSPRRPLATVMS
ncbi:nitroreductase [Paraburkholderia sp. BL10I2N1]|uniref:Acg family FMN-binding oxidoreductase n=1 Tax=Paraburkholderia sp. BL10I2N1 TaxID=1938796 RepID=UPI001FB73F65|nr:nitroreductase [Paraburkholderia sp. BL10I2N1]